MDTNSKLEAHKREIGTQIWKIMPAITNERENISRMGRTHYLIIAEVLLAQNIALPCSQLQHWKLPAHIC